MAAEDLKLVRRWFAALERGEPAPELCHEEIEIRNSERFPLRGPYRGHEGLRRWWSDFAEVIEDARFELREMVDLGDGEVFTSQSVRGRFRLTGIDLEGPFGSIVTVRDGKILSAVGYASPGEARKAAGLSRPAGG
jgi:ketosteroid isomerase-like protein